MKFRKGHRRNLSGESVKDNDIEDESHLLVSYSVIFSAI